jgi:hypothetical protein
MTEKCIEPNHLSSNEVTKSLNYDNAISASRIDDTNDDFNVIQNSLKKELKDFKSKFESHFNNINKNDLQ